MGKTRKVDAERTAKDEFIEKRKAEAVGVEICGKCGGCVWKVNGVKICGDCHSKI